MAASWSTWPIAAVGILLMLSLHVFVNAETCRGLEPQVEGGTHSTALLQTGATSGKSVAAETDVKEALFEEGKVEEESTEAEDHNGDDESILEEESTEQMATEDEAKIEEQEQAIQAVEVVFPAPSIDIASFLQSDAPFALLATSSAHVFSVLLDHKLLGGSTNNDGEYVTEGVNFTEIGRPSLAQVKRVNGTMYTPPGIHDSCPSNTFICNGILYPNKFHQTSCVCFTSSGASGHASGAFPELPKKVIQAKIHQGLNSDDLDAAVRQIAYVADKETKQTLLMVDRQYVDAIESRREHGHHQAQVGSKYGYYLRGGQRFYRM